MRGTTARLRGAETYDGPASHRLARKTRISSDGGGVLLSEVDKRIGMTGRLSKCFVDHRNPASVEHTVDELVSQRIYGLALGYEDLNDHGELRSDALMSVLVGKTDITGETRIRERDRGHALASASTLNRLELGEPNAEPRTWALGSGGTGAFTPDSERPLRPCNHRAN